MLHYFTEFIINVQKEDNITIYFWRKKKTYLTIYWKPKCFFLGDAICGLILGVARLY
jgi:hypothetical protein